jgi:hypothetical protein
MKIFKIVICSGYFWKKYKKICVKELGIVQVWQKKQITASTCKSKNKFAAAIQNVLMRSVF